MSQNSSNFTAFQLVAATQSVLHNAERLKDLAALVNDVDLHRVAESLQAVADRMQAKAEEYAPIALYPVDVIAPAPYAPHTRPIPYVLTDEVA